MALDIIIPVVLIAVIAPAVFLWAKQKFKDAAPVGGDDQVTAPGDRLTSTALRELATPPWRVVYEVPNDKLDGIAHVLIGPPGVFAVRTSMDPLPPVSTDPVDPKAIGAAAIERGGVDEALRRCGMSTDRLVVAHWGMNDGRELALDPVPGVTAVDGRRIGEWADGLAGRQLAESQVDLAWQTILTAIGRPDPLT
ncbi:MAG: hypothetical protein ABIP17_14720 [Ilumatobacteraceae bacterium]